MISGKCHDLATSLFEPWILIDSARRYATVEEKLQALLATINARAAVYDSEKEGALTGSETAALRSDLNEVIQAIADGNFKEVRMRLETLSEQTFMSALQKVVACECGR